MYRPTDIETALLHLVGWQQHYDTTEFEIDTELTQSDSGLYFQQVHPLLTLPNLRSIAPQFNDDDKFSAWLEKKTIAGVQKAVNRFISDKMIEADAKSLLESRMLFDGAGRLSDVITRTSSIVGMEIVPVRSRGVTTKINKIGLQFKQTGPINLYLMHSSSMSIVKKITLNKVKKWDMEWFVPTEPIYLPYYSSANDAGGSWYLVYIENELPEGQQAINKDRDWSQSPCGSCNSSDYNAWAQWSKYIEIHPLKNVVEGYEYSVDFNNDFSDDFANIFRFWDVQQNVYTYDKNYGINLEISVSCDITDFIVEQKRVFADVIARQVAVDLLRELAYNPAQRINRAAAVVSRNDILYELDGDSSSLKKSGLSYQLDRAYQAISLNLGGIDRVCIPCKTGGIKYKTV